MAEHTLITPHIERCAKAFEAGYSTVDGRRGAAIMRELAAERDSLQEDATRYRWLRSRDLDTISKGGVFAGMTPENVILNEEDLDRAIDAAMNRE